MAYDYTRQSTINTGDTITAALFNNEYNQIVNALAYSSTNEAATGHRHDGTAAQGGSIYRIGDMDFKNKIEADSTNDRWGIYVEVAAAAVEQVRFTDGTIEPVTDNDIDLGTSSKQFKDIYFSGSLNDGTIAITGWVDEDNMSSDSATLVPTQQSVKAYVDAQLTAEDLDFQADSGGALSIDLDSETLTVAGGTGIDTSGATNTVTVAIDSTVATLTGSQTLTNKVFSGGTIENAVIGGVTPAVGNFTNVTVTGTVDGRDVATDGTKLDTIETSATADQTGAEIKTLYEAEASAFTDAQFTKLAGIEALADVTDATNVDAAGATMNTDTDVSSNSWVLDEDDMSSDSATKLPTQQSVKAYVDGETSWTNATYENSWVDYSASYPSTGYRLIGDILYIRIYAKDGTIAGATIFTLPSGYRPSLIRSAVISPVDGSPVATTIQITSAGAVSASNNGDTFGIIGEFSIAL